MPILNAQLIKSAAGAVLGTAIGHKTARHGLLGAGLGVIATRIATTSIPGAVIVGGAILAKAVYDHRTATDDTSRLASSSRPTRITKKP